MADTKITALTELSTADAADLLAIVDDPAGTPESKKITVTNLHAAGDARTATLTNKTINSASNTITVTESDISDLGDYEPLGEVTAINTQTGTTYTLALSDKGKIVEMNNASANTLTIPANASVAFPTGSRVDIVQYGAGATTVEGDTGVTINGVSAGGGAIQNQYGPVSLYKRGTDEWVVIGDIGSIA